MRERLRIGEVARLVGMTPKTVRHYEKIGLLPEAERSDSGYRLYSADDLLRLDRVKRLRSLGLTLRQVRSVLGEGDGGPTLRLTLEALRTQVEAEITRLEERRRRIEEALSREDLGTNRASPSFERAMGLLGDHLAGVSESALEQDRKLWSLLDAFEWSEGYEEENEELFRYYAERPEEYRELVAVGEQIAGLADLPEGDPEVERVAQELWSYLQKHPPPEDFARPSWSSHEPVAQTLVELTMSALSPAQRRVMALLFERAEIEEDGTRDG